MANHQSYGNTPTGLPLAKPAQRGYLANTMTNPPLIYEFQYNPTQLTDSKQITLEKGESNASSSEDQGTSNMTEREAGRAFSNAEFQKVSAEGERTLSFKLTIDGRERRPDEPEQRRNKQGDILADLAILRSFLYPKHTIQNPGELQAVVEAAYNREDYSQFYIDRWFTEPPTALLVMGKLEVEGFITNLTITETLFNANLDPVRADVDITLVEKIDSRSFVIDSVNRIRQAFDATRL